MSVARSGRGCGDDEWGRRFLGSEVKSEVQTSKKVRACERNEVALAKLGLVGFLLPALLHARVVELAGGWGAEDLGDQARKCKGANEVQESTLVTGKHQRTSCASLSCQRLLRVQQIHSFVRV